MNIEEWRHMKLWRQSVVLCASSDDPSWQKLAHKAYTWMASLLYVISCVLWGGRCRDILSRNAHTYTGCIQSGFWCGSVDLPAACKPHHI